MDSAKLKVEGMHCTSCEVLLKDALEELDGVASAEASIKDNAVFVRFDGGKVKLYDIKKAISELGYKVK